MKIEKMYTDEVTRRFFNKAVRLEVMGDSGKRREKILASKTAVNEWATERQEHEMLAMRDFYANSEKPCTRVHIRDFDDVEPLLEQTRLFGPFDIDVLHWVAKVNATVPGYIKMGHDIGGRQYIQY